MCQCFEDIDRLTPAGEGDAGADTPALSRRGFLNGSVLAGLGLAVAPAAMIAAAAQPAEARGYQLIKQPSPEQQKELGRQAAAEVLKKYREVSDSRGADFRNMGAKLVAALPRDVQNKWEWSFRVLDSKEVNAFALPGGPMFLFTGLYDLVNTQDALAAVTGHEMAHVYKEHWAKAAKKQQERQLLAVGILTILKGGRGAQTAAGALETVISSKFSRSEEDEADSNGLTNLVAARYNPQGMVELFQALQKASGNGGSGPLGDFLSDHPLTADRIKKTRERIARLQDQGKRFPPSTPLRA